MALDLLPILPPSELEAQQQIPAAGITRRDIQSTGILALICSFQLSPKSVRLWARILLV
jgi:hypothetical protein